MKSKNIIRIVIATAILLLIPLVAMQFTTEVVWTFSDFVVAGVLLLGTGLAYEFIASKLTTTKQRATAGIILAGALLIVWADLAVGIFNIPGISGN